jgi:hypothetical protein
MTINEVAALLGYSQDRVKELIASGLRLPKSGEIIRLAATGCGARVEIDDARVDEFLRLLDAEEPGRHPPVSVRRELLVEAKHACAICRAVAPPQFHHMLDWAKAKNHDARHMLMVCGTCHTRCTNGEIDYKSQIVYKTQLKRVAPVDEGIDPHRAKKREEDLWTLKDLYLDVPRLFVDGLLQELTGHQVHVDYLDLLDIACEKVSSTLFHCYDKELPPLFKSFFTEWKCVTSQAGKFFAKEREWLDIANLVLTDAFPPESREEYLRFQERVEEAKHAFAVLNCYIRDQYPELDLDASDREAEKRCKAKIQKARRRRRY